MSSNPSGNLIKKKLSNLNIDISNVDGGKEVKFDCPFCGKRDKLYINTSDGDHNGMWECKVCGQKSRYWNRLSKVLKSDVKKPRSKEYVQAKSAKENKKLREIAIENWERVAEDEEAQRYLFEERAFTKEVVEEDLIGVDVYGNVTLTKMDKDGKVTGIKTKNMKYQEQLEQFEVDTAGMSKDQIEEAGFTEPAPYFGRSSEGLVNSKAIGKHKSLLIVEGYWDVYATKCFDINSVVGVPSARFKQGNWIDTLKDTKSFTLCYDNDATGQDAAYDMAKRLGFARCKNLVLPLNDVNDCLKSGMSSKEFQLLVSEAKQFDIEAISGVMDFKDKIMNRFRNKDGLLGYASGIKGLDWAIRGWRMGELTNWSGWTEVGKTTFLKTLIYALAKNGYPGLIFSFETMPDKLLHDLAIAESGKTIQDITVEEFEGALDKVDNTPVYYYNQAKEKKALTFEKFEEYLTLAKERYGVKFIVIDDLSTLIATVGSGYRTNLENKDNIIRLIKGMTVRLDIHIIAVVPLKMSQDGKQGVPNKQNLRDSIHMQYAPDNIIFVHRETRKTAAPEVRSRVQIIVDKVRDYGLGGIINFDFDVDTFKYTEVD